MILKNFSLLIVLILTFTVLVVATIALGKGYLPTNMAVLVRLNMQLDSLFGVIFMVIGIVLFTYKRNNEAIIIILMGAILIYLPTLFIVGSGPLG